MKIFIGLAILLVATMAYGIDVNFGEVTCEDLIVDSIALTGDMTIMGDTNVVITGYFKADSVSVPHANFRTLGLTGVLSTIAKGWFGTAPGATGIELTGTDPDFVFQVHSKITTDAPDGAYSAGYFTNTITSSLTHNVSAFGNFAELYLTGDLTLAGSNFGGNWGNLEIADAGGTITFAGGTSWAAAQVATVITPDGLLIPAGTNFAGYLSDASITAGYTNNGTFSAFASRSSNAQTWPVAFQVLPSSASIDFKGQNNETLDNATNGYWNLSGAVVAPSYNYATAAMVGGTGDAITINFTPDLPALAAGLEVTFLAEAPNTGAVTLAVDGGAAKAVIEAADASALEANDIRSGSMVTLVFDGTAWQQISQSGN